MMRLSVIFAAAMLLCGAQAHTYFEVADPSSSFSTAGGDFGAYTHTYNADDGARLIYEVTLPAGATGAALVDGDETGSYRNTALVLVAPLDRPLAESKTFDGNASTADLNPGLGLADISELGYHLGMGHYYIVANTSSGPISALLQQREPAEGHSSYSEGPAMAPGPAMEDDHSDHSSDDDHSSHGSAHDHSEEDHSSHGSAPAVSQQSSLTSAAVPAAAGQAGALLAALLAALALLA